MTRVLFLSVVATLIASCGGNSNGNGGGGQHQSLCEQTPAPAACQTTCDPSAAADSCPSGFHCGTGGKCDTVCTIGGSECGSGFVCSSNGNCIDDGSGGGGGGGGGGNEPDANCPDLHFTATKVTPSIQLLIDRSGSMANDFNDQAIPRNGTNPQKFKTEVDALVGTSGVVTELQASVYFGASMYPSSSCPGLVTAPRALNNKDKIAALFAANGPAGSTPTSVSIDAAVADFQRTPPPAGSPPAIVLATDGLPNACGSNGGADPAAQAASVTAAANSFKAGIPLYVLVVGSKFGDQFKQDLANAGQGVQSGAVAYQATDPASLAQAFQDIIKGVVSCDLQLTNGMVNPDEGASGTVTVNGKALTYKTDWTLDPSGTVIHLLGSACTDLKNAANPVVDATFPCDGGIIF